MKNILVIDGAENCAYDIFAVSDKHFKILFPGKKQDIEFIEDVLKRVSKKDQKAIFDQIWKNPVPKKKAKGIHGILFYELKKRKAKFYPNKRDSDLDGIGR
ncbi:MAG: hypothetical protein EYC62_09005 [Alphaproteobacteria bacterium]|nr:MAG: hypothetical protein EYC62_09005 [Alphaproteobacteria bacterium]